MLEKLLDHELVAFAEGLTEYTSETGPFFADVSVDGILDGILAAPHEFDPGQLWPELYDDDGDLLPEVCWKALLIADMVSNYAVPTHYSRWRHVEYPDTVGSEELWSARAEINKIVYKRLMQ